MGITTRANVVQVEPVGSQSRFHLAAGTSWCPSAPYTMSCPCCRVADAVEHYLDFLALFQEGLQQQVGVLVKSSLGDLADEVWIPIPRPGTRCHPWTPGFSV